MKATATISFAAAGVAALGVLCSCSPKERLANGLEGRWEGTPVKISDATPPASGKASHDFKWPTVAQGTTVWMAPNLEFHRDLSKEGGTLDFSAEFKITREVESETLKTPVLATAHLNATATATWTALDDDEVSVTFDPKTITVTLDPANVELSFAHVTDRSDKELEELKERVGESLEKRLTSQVSEILLEIKEFDDVEAIGSTLTFEIGDRDFSFTKM